MPIKTKAELLALFADNTTGDISAADMRDFVDSVVRSCGSCYFSTPAATSNVAATPIKAAGTTTTMELTGFTSPLDNRLTYIDTEPVVFEVMFTGSVIKGGGGATESSMFIYKNGVAVPGAHIERTIPSSTDTGAFAVSCQISLVTNDYVELWCETDTGDDVTVQAGVLSVKAVGV